MKVVHQIRSAKQIILSILAVSMLVACGTDNQNEQAAYTPQVEVASVAVASLATWHDFTGTTQAPQSIDLRPRVSGYIDQVHFVEGSTVQQGDLLFSIDDAPFVAEVSRLQADLAIANSQYDLAQKDFVRASQLIKQRAISDGQLDAAEAQVQQNKARIKSVEAALTAAQLQLGYTRISAPISGRVSNAYITKGNYVNAGDSILTNLVSTQKLYTYFDANQSTYLDYKKANTSAQAMPVMMSIEDTVNYNISGVIDFVDNRINPQTGTIRARALINNEEGDLVPGLFSRLRVYGNAIEDAVLIKDEAIGTDLNNKYVLVLNDKNIAEYKAITLGEKIENLRIVTSGLLPTDKVVVNGLQRIRPGSQVEPIMVSMASKQSLANIAQTQSQIAKARLAIENAEQQRIAAKPAATDIPLAVVNTIAAGK